jgi:hypothetical protein
MTSLLSIAQKRLFLGGSQPAGRVGAGALHLGELVAVPGPAGAALLQREVLAGGEVERDRAYSPAVGVFVRRSGIGFCDLAPCEQLRAQLVDGIEQQPRPDRCAEVHLKEGDRNVDAGEDVAAHGVRFGEGAAKAQPLPAPGAGRARRRRGADVLVAQRAENASLALPCFRRSLAAHEYEDTAKACGGCQ